MNKPTPQFRYDTSSNWYKGNTHLHSTASDGGKSFPELAGLYHAAAYNFLFRTDHWVLSDAERDPEDYPLLWLDGVELDGQDHTGADYHVVCLGKLSGLRQENGLEAALQAAHAQGALTVLAHPHWCGNSLEDVTRFPFDGVEVYNHICHWLNGKSNGLVHWEFALRHNPNTLAFSVDDGHHLGDHSAWNGGWIVVKAPECTRPAILDAIRRGNYYSSCGPEFHSISFDGEQVHLQTSPVRYVRLVGPGWHGHPNGIPKGRLIRQISLPLPQDWPYAYLEIEDTSGRRAWTNNLFIFDP
jgi:hypothetical protein